MDAEERNGVGEKGGIISSMNIADGGLPNSNFGPPPAEPKATFPEQPESRTQDSLMPAVDTTQFPSKEHITKSDTCVNSNNSQEHTSHPDTPTKKKHVSEGISEDEDQVHSEQAMVVDGVREGCPGDEHLVGQKRTYAVYSEEEEPPHHFEAQARSLQAAQSKTGEIKQPPTKKRVVKSEYSCGKNAREQAVVRQRKRHDRLKRHIRALVLKQGYNLEAAEVPPPPPIRRRKTKPQTEESDDSDDSIDSDEQEPEAHVVSAKDRLKEIGGAVNSASGLTNRRTGSQKEDLKEGKTTFGYGKVKCIGKGDEMLWCLRGMKAHLKPFQLVAVSWMVQRETDDGLYKGGLLADTPGFGKTVMSLGTIIGNPPSPELIAEGYKATLVVVPNVAILKQWEQQIREHLTEENATFYHYKESSNVLGADRINDMNIVLVTYQEIQRGWPSEQRRQEFSAQCTTLIASDDGQVTPKVDEARYHDLCWDNTSMLFYIKWYRVIFDEVHTVKNVNSQTCLAAQNLKYHIFWGLSGTPLVNAAKEMFPYLSLIKWTDVTSETEYKEKYLKDPDGRGRIDALVSLLTYRRTHKDRFLGKKMVPLHKSHQATQWVDLTTEERVIYDLTTELFSIDGAQNGAQLKLRQRQAVSHFFLLESFFRSSAGALALQNFITKVAKVENKKTAYEQIGSWFQRQHPGLNAPNDDGSSQSSTLEPFGKSSFGGKFRLTPLLQILLNTRKLKENECKICDREEGNFEDPCRLPDCEHIFCNQCIVKLWIRHLSRGVAPKCPKCNTPYQGNDWSELPRVDFVSAAQPQQAPTTADTRKKRAKKSTEFFGEAPERRPGDDFFRTQPSFGEESGGLWAKVVLDDMFRNGGVPTPSSKITAVKDIVLRWIKEDHKHKGIIFTQFVTTALLIGRMLQLEGIHFVYLTGKNTSAEKLKAIEGFKLNSNIRYLVASMRCGGQSLNLTCANRVIMCDTWWNRAAEEQAFGRVFRLGQLRSTHNIRILARNTIDEEIDRMHQVKAKAIEHTMQDDGHATQFFSEFEITKVLEPEKWLAWVQQCIAEICEEDGIAPESMDVDAAPDQEPNAQTTSTETEQSMASILGDMREQKVSPGKMNTFDLEDDSDGDYLPENQPPANPYGVQDIGREF